MIIVLTRAPERARVNQRFVRYFSLTFDLRPCSASPSTCRLVCPLERSCLFAPCTPPRSPPSSKTRGTVRSIERCSNFQHLMIQLDSRHIIIPLAAIHVQTSVVQNAVQMKEALNAKFCNNCSDSRFPILTFPNPEPSALISSRTPGDPGEPSPSTATVPAAPVATATAAVTNRMRQHKGRRDTISLLLSSSPTKPDSLKIRARTDFRRPECVCLTIARDLAWALPSLPLTSISGLVVEPCYVATCRAR